MCNLESGLEGCRWTKEIFHLTTVKVEFLPAWVRPSHNCHQCNLERHNIMYSAQLGTLLPWLPPVPPENTYQHSLLKAPWSHTSATRWYMLSWLVTYCPRSSQLVFILIRICHLLPDKFHPIELTDLIWRWAQQLCQVVHEPNLRRKTWLHHNIA